MTATMVHEDDDLLDLTIHDGEGKSALLRTTDRHRIWNLRRRGWTYAQDLRVGDRLQQADGSPATVMARRERAGRQLMLDLTVAENHTFYVAVGRATVLVHNIECTEWARRYVAKHGGRSTESAIHCSRLNLIPVTMETLRATGRITILS